MTVVTDMVTTHAFWFDRRADLVVVPTDEAREVAIEYGIPAGNVRVVGLPTAERFRVPPADPMAFRDAEGWRRDLPVILVVGGGDGMGPMEAVVKAINEARLNATLVAICGRNEALQERLRALPWTMPHHIYGFTTQMPEFMAAADMLVTKAGPGTISEGFIAGLPLVLYSRLPGQEDGNVAYVVEEEGRGVGAASAPGGGRRSALGRRPGGTGGGGRGEPAGGQTQRRPADRPDHRRPGRGVLAGAAERLRLTRRSCSP